MSILRRSSFYIYAIARGASVYHAESLFSKFSFNIIDNWLCLQSSCACARHNKVVKKIDISINSTHGCADKRKLVWVWWLSISAVLMTERNLKCDCAKVELKKKNQLPAQLVCALICVKIETVGGWVRAYCQYVVSVLQASKIKEVRSTYRARQSILGSWSVTPNPYWSDKGRRRYVVMHVCKCWKLTCSAELLSPPAGSKITYILSTCLWRHRLHQCSWH